MASTGLLFGTQLTCVLLNSFPSGTFGGAQAFITAKGPVFALKGVRFLMLTSVERKTIVLHKRLRKGVFERMNSCGDYSEPDI